MPPLRTVCYSQAVPEPSKRIRRDALTKIAGGRKFQRVAAEWTSFQCGISGKLK